LEQAEAAARQRRDTLAFAQAVAQPGCAFANLAGVSPFLPSFNTGGFQTLEPFQPGLIQVPRQNYNYSFLQVHRTRGPRPLPLPRSGYRRDFRISNTR
jgi:hypothetical protein